MFELVITSIFMFDIDQMVVCCHCKENYIRWEQIVWTKIVFKYLFFWHKRISNPIPFWENCDKRDLISSEAYLNVTLMPEARSIASCVVTMSIMFTSKRRLFLFCYCLLLLHPTGKRKKRQKLAYQIRWNAYQHQSLWRQS